MPTYVVPCDTLPFYVQNYLDVAFKCRRSLQAKCRLQIVYPKNEVKNVYLNSSMEKIASRTQGAYRKIVDMRESCRL